MNCLDGHSPLTRGKSSWFCKELAAQALPDRDIKPGNILVDTAGDYATLGDLGLAQIADDVEGRLTRTWQFVGTLRYASPEQVTGQTFCSSKCAGALLNNGSQNVVDGAWCVLLSWVRKGVCERLPDA